VLEFADAFDWRNNNGQNYLPPVRNQGSCGSCWAFGTVAPLEALLKIRQGLAVDLSEQYLVSCSFNEAYDYGCGGGWFAHQYHQWKIPRENRSAGRKRSRLSLHRYGFRLYAPPCASPENHELGLCEPRQSVQHSLRERHQKRHCRLWTGGGRGCAGPAMSAYRGEFSPPMKAAPSAAAVSTTPSPWWAGMTPRAPGSCGIPGAPPGRGRLHAH